MIQSRTLAFLREVSAMSEILTMEQITARYAPNWVPFVPVADRLRAGMGTTSDGGEACDPRYAVEVGVGTGQCAS
jgi:hypothetical protein